MLAIIYSRYHHFLKEKEKPKSDQLLCVVSVSVSTVIHQFVCIAYCIYSDFLLGEKDRERKRERCDCFLWPMWPLTERRMTFYFCTVWEHFYENEEHTILQSFNRFCNRATKITTKLQLKKMCLHTQYQNFWMCTLNIA